MKKTQIAVLALFLLVALFTMVQSSNVRASNPMAVQIMSRSIFESLGVFVAAGSAVALLLASLGEAKPARMLSLLFPFLAGIMMTNFHWSVPVCLTTIVIAILTKQTVHSRQAKVPTPEVTGGESRE